MLTEHGQRWILFYKLEFTFLLTQPGRKKPAENMVEVGVIVLSVLFCTPALALRTRLHGNNYVGQLAVKSPWNILVAAKAPLSSPPTSHHCLEVSLLQACFQGFRNVHPAAHLHTGLETSPLLCCREKIMSPGNEKFFPAKLHDHTLSMVG